MNFQTFIYSKTEYHATTFYSTVSTYFRMSSNLFALAHSRIIPIFKLSKEKL